MGKVSWSTTPVHKSCSLDGQSELEQKTRFQAPKKLKKTRIFTVEKSVTLTTLTPNDHFSASFVQNHVFSRCIFILLPPLPNETLTFDPILSPN
jgi:hypothetical protein